MTIKNIYLSVMLIIICSIGAFAQTSQPSYRPNTVYAPTPNSGKENVPYDHIREADVFWQKRIWRMIDTKEKMNLPFTYPKELFFSILQQAVLKEGVMAFNPIDDDFTTPYQLKELAALGSKIDTEYVPDPITGAQVMKVINSPLNPENITKFKIKEDWFFDNETGTMQVRIVGICPVMDKYDEAGNLLGQQPLYWIYFPDLRPVLMKHEVFNPQNDVVRMTWDDVMQFRRFSSYITKESNVYDRRITDYTNGLDALLEAERIKTDMINYEEDLWSH